MSGSIRSSFLHSVPIQVGTTRLLSGVTAEYKTEIGEEYRDGQKKAGPRLGDPPTSCVFMQPIRLTSVLHTVIG